MTKPSDYAKVFRAAADGYMSPYRVDGGIFSSSSHDAAKSAAGAMSAIATVFENMAKAEEQPLNNAGK